MIRYIGLFEVITLDRFIKGAVATSRCGNNRTSLHKTSLRGATSLRLSNQWSGCDLCC